MEAPRVRNSGHPDAKAVPQPTIPRGKRGKKGKIKVILLPGRTSLTLLWVRGPWEASVMPPPVAHLSCPGAFPLRLSYMSQIFCFLSPTRAGRSPSRLRR